MTSSESEQRREAFRVGLVGVAHVRRRSGEVLSFELRDLSVRGARLLGAATLDVDEALEIELPVGEERIVVAARVVRCDAHGCSVRFHSLSNAPESRIARFLTDEQRRRGRPRG